MTGLPPGTRRPRRDAGPFGFSGSRSLTAESCLDSSSGGPNTGQADGAPQQVQRDVVGAGPCAMRSRNGACLFSFLTKAISVPDRCARCNELAITQRADPSGSALRSSTLIDLSLTRPSLPCSLLSGRWGTCGGRCRGRFAADARSSAPGPAPSRSTAPASRPRAGSRTAR